MTSTNRALEKKRRRRAERSANCDFGRYTNNTTKESEGPCNSPKGNRIRLLAGRANPLLAEKISKHLDIPLCVAKISELSNGETDVSISENIRGMDVFIIQPTVSNPNDDLMELLIMADACARSSASRITAVIPCMGYARQDKKEKGRVPITMKLVTNMLEVAGVNRILTVDIHSAEISGFTDLPIDILYAQPFLTKWIQENIPEEKVVVSPGVTGVKRAKQISAQLDCPIAIIHFGTIVHGGIKEEVGATTEKMKVVGEVKGKVAILVSDLEDTCTLHVSMEKILLAQGATQVFTVVTHGILSGNAISNLNQSQHSQLVVTNTVKCEDKQMETSKLSIIDISSLIAEAIRRIHHGDSVSNLLASQWGVSESFSKGNGLQTPKVVKKNSTEESKIQ